MALEVLDLVGIFVFGITGALVGVRKKLDVFGIQVLALVTGLGGGFIRDVLIGGKAVPPAALADWRYLVVPVSAGLITFFLHPGIGRVERLVNVFDAAGLALFCVTGARKALDYGLSPLSAALLGTISGIGGGVIRDLLSGRVPVVLRQRDLRHPRLPRRRHRGRRRRRRLPSDLGRVRRRHRLLRHPPDRHPARLERPATPHAVAPPARRQVILAGAPSPVDAAVFVG